MPPCATWWATGPTNSLASCRPTPTGTRRPRPALERQRHRAGRQCVSPGAGEPACGTAMGRRVHHVLHHAPYRRQPGQHIGWMSSVVNITAQKRAEEQQQQRETQLQRVQRVITVGEMASTLAHELNQPLAALVNYAAAARTGRPGQNRATERQPRSPVGPGAAGCRHRGPHSPLGAPAPRKPRALRPVGHRRAVAGAALARRSPPPGDCGARPFSRGLYRCMPITCYWSRW